jgi:hypothetical protein
MCPLPDGAANSVGRLAERWAGLNQLEEHIGDCLAHARGIDRQQLAEIIELLRSARNGVVRQGGG